MPYNLPLTVFTQINFVADFLQRSSIIQKKRPFAFLSPPFGGLRGNVR